MTTDLADERLRLVGLGDAGDERALLGADVDRQLQQLLRLLHAFGGQHLRDAQLDLHEVVDARCDRRGAGAAAGWRGRRESAVRRLGAGRSAVSGWNRMSGTCVCRTSSAFLLDLGARPQRPFLQRATRSPSVRQRPSRSNVRRSVRRADAAQDLLGGRAA